MSTLTPKQLEIRRREAQILETASPLIRDGGLAAISMDAIAKKMRYTRGTIYNHFPNKEDILLALASRAVSRRVELFLFAQSLGRTSRQRIAAVGIACEVYADILPDDFAVEQMIRHDVVWAKSSDKRRELLEQTEMNCMGSVVGIVNDAIEDGDLKLPKHRSATDVCFGLWSLVYGGMVLEATSPSLAAMGIADSRLAIRRNCNAMLDGLNWTPLYDTATYNRFVKRILPRVTEEAKRIASVPSSDEASTEVERIDG